jgi:hypothetical protein
MVLAKRDNSIRQVLSDIDVVEKPPIALKPQAREILFVIQRIENSNRKPTDTEIAKEMLLDAGEEIVRQPLVKSGECVSRFGNKLIVVEEIPGKVKINVEHDELKKELHRLVEAGYLAVQYEGEGKDRKTIFVMTPEAKDQIGKFMRTQGLV